MIGLVLAFGCGLNDRSKRTYVVSATQNGPVHVFVPKGVQHVSMNGSLTFPSLREVGQCTQVRSASGQEGETRAVARSRRMAGRWLPSSGARPGAITSTNTATSRTACRADVRYLGNGSVVDLQIKSGLIKAIVAGSETYTVTIKIKTLAAKTWKSLRQDCSQSIHSLIDLLQGRFDEGVMRRLAQPDGGLFPHPQGNRHGLQLSRLRRGVQAHRRGRVWRRRAARHVAGTAVYAAQCRSFGTHHASPGGRKSRTVSHIGVHVSAGSDLGELFGINLDTSSDAPTKSTSKAIRKARTAKSPTSESPTSKSPTTITVVDAPSQRSPAAPKRRSTSSKCHPKQMAK